MFELDEQFFLYLNSFHSDGWDKAMVTITAKETWFPLYALILGILIGVKPKRAITVSFALAIAVGLSDYIASGIFKPWIERLRPCHDPRWTEVIHTVNHCGGKYGFFSSHASTTFALAVFLIYVFRKDTFFVWLLLPWAMMVSYSRIYLGVHYPLDVFTGALTGSLMGWIVAKGFLNMEDKLLFLR